jgi:hypothetical protein
MNEGENFQNVIFLVSLVKNLTTFEVSTKFLTLGSSKLIYSAEAPGPLKWSDFES